MVISAGDPLGPDGPGPTARARRPGTASYFQDINIETVSNEYSYGEHPRLIFLKDLNSEIKASNLKSYIEKLLYFCRTKSKLHASRPHLTLPLASLALSITYSSPFTRKQSFDSSVEFLQFQFGLKGRFCVSSCFKICYCSTAYLLTSIWGTRWTAANRNRHPMFLYLSKKEMIFFNGFKTKD